MAEYVFIVEYYLSSEQKFGSKTFRTIDISPYHKYLLIINTEQAYSSPHQLNQKKKRDTLKQVPNNNIFLALLFPGNILQSMLNNSRHTMILSPVAETGFSHRLTAYKIMGHFFGLSYRKISGNNQVKNCFFLESVAFQFHARMLSSEVAQSLKSYGNFSDLGVGIALSHRHVVFFK